MSIGSHVQCRHRAVKCARCSLQVMSSAGKALHLCSVCSVFCPHNVPYRIYFLLRKNTAQTLMKFVENNHYRDYRLNDFILSEIRTGTREQAMREIQVDVSGLHGNVQQEQGSRLWEKFKSMLVDCTAMSNSGWFLASEFTNVTEAHKMDVSADTISH